MTSYFAIVCLFLKTSFLFFILSFFLFFAHLKVIFSSLSHSLSLLILNSQFCLFDFFAALLSLKHRLSSMLRFDPEKKHVSRKMFKDHKIIRLCLSRQPSGGSMVQGYDSRFGCERPRVQIPVEPMLLFCFFLLNLLNHFICNLA